MGNPKATTYKVTPSSEQRVPVDPKYPNGPTLLKDGKIQKISCPTGDECVTTFTYTWDYGAHNKGVRSAYKTGYAYKTPIASPIFADEDGGRVPTTTDETSLHWELRNALIFWLLKMNKQLFWRRKKYFGNGIEENFTVAKKKEVLDELRSERKKAFIPAAWSKTSAENYEGFQPIPSDKLIEKIANEKVDADWGEIEKKWMKPYWEKIALTDKYWPNWGLRADLRLDGELGRCGDGDDNCVWDVLQKELKKKKKRVAEGGGEEKKKKKKQKR